MIVKNKFTEILVVILIIVLGLLWKLVELPFNISCYKPNVLLLGLFFIMIYIPSKINIWTAWVIGIMADSMHGFVLGNEALQFAFMALIVNVFHRRIFLHPLLQKCLVIMGISVVVALINTAIYQVIFDEFNPCYMYGILVNPIIYPLYFWVANNIHKFSYSTK